MLRWKTGGMFLVSNKSLPRGPSRTALSYSDKEREEREEHSEAEEEEESAEEEEGSEEEEEGNEEEEEEEEDDEDEDKESEGESAAEEESTEEEEGNEEDEEEEEDDDGGDDEDENEESEDDDVEEEKEDDANKGDRLVRRVWMASAASMPDFMAKLTPLMREGFMISAQAPMSRPPGKVSDGRVCHPPSLMSRAPYSMHFPSRRRERTKGLVFRRCSSSKGEMKGF